MQDMIEMSIMLHVVFIYAMVFLGCINLYFILRGDGFVNFTKKIKFVSPQYYMMLSAIFFTGLIVLGVSRFDMTWSIVLMIIAWLLIFILSIKSFKIYKRTHIKNIDSQNAYKKFAIKKYSIDIFLLVIVSIISYIW